MSDIDCVEVSKTSSLLEHTSGRSVNSEVGSTTGCSDEASEWTSSTPGFVVTKYLHFLLTKGPERIR